ADRGDGVSDRRYPTGAGQPGGRAAQAGGERLRGRGPAAAALGGRAGCAARQTRLAISRYSRRAAPVYSWRGRPMRMPGSEIISCQCATQPTVRAIANITVNIER